MSKKLVSIRLRKNTVDFLDNIAEQNNISRSQLVDIISEMAQDYFSDSNLATEIRNREIPIAPRKKNQD